jgi:hypothetical protein
VSNYFWHMHIPQELGDSFIDVFARMEYALKASNTYADGDSHSVGPARPKDLNDFLIPL